MTTRLLASGPETQLGSKLLLSVLILAVFGGLCWLMRRGYQRLSLIHI